MYVNHFRPGLRPGLQWGAYSAPQTPTPQTPGWWGRGLAAQEPHHRLDSAILAASTPKHRRKKILVTTLFRRHEL